MYARSLFIICMAQTGVEPLDLSPEIIETKTVLDLLHSLGVDDADIRFDNFGG